MTFDTPKGGEWQVQLEHMAEKQVLMLKQLTWHYVIQDPALKTQQYGQRRVIRELFEIYEKAVMGGRNGANWGILPKNHQ